jgi:hypothetical protein
LKSSSSCSLLQFSATFSLLGSVRSILILSFHLFLGFSSITFPSATHTKFKRNPLSELAGEICGPVHLPRCIIDVNSSSMTQPLQLRIKVKGKVVCPFA